MKNLLAVLLVACFISTALLPRTLQADGYRSDVKNTAESRLVKLQPLIDVIEADGRLCDLGVMNSWRSVKITRVSELGLRNGLRPGDKLLSLDGAEVNSDNINGVQSQYVAGDTFVARLSRNGAHLDVEGVCGDDTQYILIMAQMYESAAKGRFQKCFDLTYELDQSNGRPTAFTANWRNQCSEAIRCSDRRCKNATNQDATLLYDYQRLAIEELLIIDSLDEMRSWVLAAISWLEDNGYQRFARELELDLQKAESSRGRATAEHVPSNPPKSAYGTCFAVSDSEVLTSYHVVANADLITVQFEGGAEKGAVVAQQSQSTDLALLMIGGNSPTFLPMAPMRSLEVGQEVFTVGYPVTSILGSDPKFTDGSVSALSGVQDDASFFQMSVPVQPGNSGGPVVNVYGEVVGVVAATAAFESFYELSGALPQNVNWASKSDYARLLFDPPSSEARARNRGEAIEMAKAAVCRVTAVSN